MSTKTITQREARALQRRVAALEYLEECRRNEWTKKYPGGVHIGSITVADSTLAKVRTARLLQHAVVAVNNDQGEIMLYALPVAKDTNP